MLYLLDTNVLSEPVKERPNAGVLRKLRENRDRCCTAAPVWSELLYGCRRLPQSKRRKKLQSYLGKVLAPALTILPYDARAADWHAEERARLSLLGKMPAFVDSQIAAVTVVHHLILVTHNVTDFTDFADLTVEDWTEQTAGDEASDVR